MQKKIRFFWKNRIFSHRIFSRAAKKIRSLNTSGQAFWKNRIFSRALMQKRHGRGCKPRPAQSQEKQYNRRNT
jgi:hypothetical protein